MQQTSTLEINENGMQYIPLENSFELCLAREEMEIEAILSSIFLSELTNQFISRNLDNY